MNNQDRANWKIGEVVETIFYKDDKAQIQDVKGHPVATGTKAIILNIYKGTTFGFDKCDVVLADGRVCTNWYLARFKKAEPNPQLSFDF